MALKNSKNYQGEMMRNAGILKIDQVELVEKSSAPSDSDLADGRIYYNSSDEQFSGYVNGAWVGITPKYGSYYAATVKNVTTSTTLTIAESGSHVMCASVGGSLRLELPSAASSAGCIFYITNSSANATTGDLYLTAYDGDWIAGATGANYVSLNATYDSIILVSDGSTAWIRAGYIS